MEQDYQIFRNALWEHVHICDLPDNLSPQANELAEQQIREQFIRELYNNSRSETRNYIVNTSNVEHLSYVVSAGDNVDHVTANGIGEYHEGGKNLGRSINRFTSTIAVAMDASFNNLGEIISFDQQTGVTASHEITHNYQYRQGYLSDPRMAEIRSEDSFHLRVIENIFTSIDYENGNLNFRNGEVKYDENLGGMYKENIKLETIEASYIKARSEYLKNHPSKNLPDTLQAYLEISTGNKYNTNNYLQDYISGVQASYEEYRGVSGRDFLQEIKNDINRIQYNNTDFSNSYYVGGSEEETKYIRDIENFARFSDEENYFLDPQKKVASGENPLAKILLPNTNEYFRNEVHPKIAALTPEYLVKNLQFDIDTLVSFPQTYRTSDQGETYLSIKVSGNDLSRFNLLNNSLEKYTFAYDYVQTSDGYEFRVYNSNDRAGANDILNLQRNLVSQYLTLDEDGTLHTTNNYKQLTEFEKRSISYCMEALGNENIFEIARNNFNHNLDLDRISKYVYQIYENGEPTDRYGFVFDDGVSKEERQRVIDAYDRAKDSGNLPEHLIGVSEDIDSYRQPITTAAQEEINFGRTTIENHRGENYIELKGATSTEARRFDSVPEDWTVPEPKPKNYDQIRQILEAKAFIGHGGEQFKINANLNANLFENLGVSVEVDLEKLNFPYYRDIIAIELYETAQSDIDRVSNIIENPSNHTPQIVEEATEAREFYNRLLNDQDFLYSNADAVIEGSAEYFQSNDEYNKIYSSEEFISESCRAKDYIAYKICELPENTQNNFLYSENYQIETYLNENTNKDSGHLVQKTSVLKEGSLISRRTQQVHNIIFGHYTDTQTFLHEIGHSNDFGLKIFNTYVFDDIALSPSSREAWLQTINAYVESDSFQHSDLNRGHLEGNYDRADFAVEIQAEIERIYSDAYMQSGGDFKQVDHLMNKSEYKDLWESYKTNFLSEYEKYYTPEILTLVNSQEPISPNLLSSIDFEYSFNTESFENMLSVDTSKLKLEDQIILKKYLSENEIRFAREHGRGTHIFFSKRHEATILGHLGENPPNIKFGDLYYDQEKGEYLRVTRENSTSPNLKIKDPRTGSTITINNDGKIIESSSELNLESQSSNKNSAQNINEILASDPKLKSIYEKNINRPKNLGPIKNPLAYAGIPGTTVYDPKHAGEAISKYLSQNATVEVGMGEVVNSSDLSYFSRGHINCTSVIVEVFNDGNLVDARQRHIGYAYNSRLEAEFEEINQMPGEKVVTIIRSGKSEEDYTLQSDRTKATVNEFVKSKIQGVTISELNFPTANNIDVYYNRGNVTVIDQGEYQSIEYGGGFTLESPKNNQVIYNGNPTKDLKSPRQSPSNNIADNHLSEPPSKDPQYIIDSANIKSAGNWVLDNESGEYKIIYRENESIRKLESSLKNQNIDYKIINDKDFGKILVVEGENLQKFQELKSFTLINDSSLAKPLDDYEKTFLDPRRKYYDQYDQKKYASASSSATNILQSYIENLGGEVKIHDLLNFAGSLRQHVSHDVGQNFGSHGLLISDQLSSVATDIPNDSKLYKGLIKELKNRNQLSAGSETHSFILENCMTFVSKSGVRIMNKGLEGISDLDILLQDIKDWDGKNVNSFHKMMAELNYELITRAPFESGNASTIDMISKALYQNKGFEVGFYKPQSNISWDVDAQISNKKDFVTRYLSLYEKPPIYLNHNHSPQHKSFLNRLSGGYLGATAIGIPAAALASGGSANKITLFGHNDEALVNLNNVAENVRNQTQRVIELASSTSKQAEDFARVRSQNASMATGATASGAMLALTYANYDRIKAQNDLDQSFGGARADYSKRANNMLKTDLTISAVGLVDDAIRLTPVIASGLTNFALSGTGLSTTGDEFVNMIASSSRAQNLLSKASIASNGLKYGSAILAPVASYATGQYMENVAIEAQDGHREMKERGRKHASTAVTTALVVGMVLAPVTFGTSAAIVGGIALSIAATEGSAVLYDHLWGDQQHNEYVQQNMEELKKCTEVIGSISCKMNENFHIGVELSHASIALDEAILNGNQEDISQALENFNKAADGLKDIQLLSVDEIIDLKEQQNFLKEQARNVASWQTDREPNGEIIDEGQLKILGSINEQLQIIEETLAYDELSSTQYLKWTDKDWGGYEINPEYQERIDFVNDIADKRIEQLNQIDARDKFVSFAEHANQELKEYSVSSDNLQTEDELRMGLYQLIEDGYLTKEQLDEYIIDINKAREQEQQDLDALIARQEKIGELISSQEKLLNDPHYKQYAEQAIQSLQEQQTAINQTLENYVAVNQATDQTVALANETLEIRSQMLEDEQLYEISDYVFASVDKISKINRQSKKDNLNPDQAILNNAYLNELSEVNNKIISQYNETIEQLKEAQANAPEILKDDYQAVIDQHEAVSNRYANVKKQINEAQGILIEEVTERVIQFPDQDSYVVLANDGSVASYSVDGEVYTPAEGEKVYLGDMEGDFVNNIDEAQQSKDALVIVAYDKEGKAVITGIGQPLRTTEEDMEQHLDKLKDQRGELKENGIKYRQIKKTMKDTKKAYDGKEEEFDPVQEAAKGLINSGAVVASEGSYNSGLSSQEEKERVV